MYRMEAACQYRSICWAEPRTAAAFERVRDSTIALGKKLFSKGGSARNAVAGDDPKLEREGIDDRASKADRAEFSMPRAKWRGRCTTTQTSAPSGVAAWARSIDAVMCLK